MRFLVLFLLALLIVGWKAADGSPARSVSWPFTLIFRELYSRKMFIIIFIQGAEINYRTFRAVHLDPPKTNKRVFFLSSKFQEVEIWFTWAEHLTFTVYISNILPTHFLCLFSFWYTRRPHAPFSLEWIKVLNYEENHL